MPIDPVQKPNGKFDKMMDALCSYWLAWNRFSGHDG